MSLPRRPLALALGAALLLAPAAGCAGKKKARAEAELAALGVTAMYERAMGQLSESKLRQAKELLERIQFEGDPASREKLEPLVRLALADVTFYQPGDLALIDARSLYLDFVTLYGDHPLAPYAQLQAGYCSTKAMRGAAKDQAQTYQAIADLTEVLRRWRDTRWAVAAETLLARARKNLAESEFVVGKFYLDRKAYRAASERFKTVLASYPEYDEKPKILYYLAESLLRAKDKIEAQTYLDQIVTQYPEDRYATQARRTLAALAQPAPEAEVPR